MTNAQYNSCVCFFYFYRLIEDCSIWKKEIVGEYVIPATHDHLQPPRLHIPCFMCGRKTVNVRRESVCRDGWLPPRECWCPSNGPDNPTSSGSGINMGVSETTSAICVRCWLLVEQFSSGGRSIRNSRFLTPRRTEFASKHFMYSVLESLLFKAVPVDVILCAAYRIENAPPNAGFYYYLFSFFINNTNTARIN